jgi:GNAT superfamily N-acetyltransferase
MRPARLDDPDARRLIAAVQAEYTVLYGNADHAPIDVSEFTDPRGVFLIGYVDGIAAAMGGWRRHGDEHPDTAWAGSRAELKRMYVAPPFRAQGYSRTVLTELELSARRAGVGWMLLETGYMQPGAIALYRSCGYDDVPAFGHYADTELSVHLGRPLSDDAPPRPPVSSPTPS